MNYKITIILTNKTMEQLANYFGMTEEGLGQLLYTTNSFIAGGAPLAVFQKTIYPDMDLDIFLRIPVEWNNEPWKLSYDTGKGFYFNYEGLAKEKINGFLTTHGYELVKENDASRWSKINSQLPHSYLKNTETPDIEYMQSALSHFIKNINTYQRDDGRKIQIITLFDCLIENFMETFDLNICRLVIVGNNFSIQNTNWCLELMTSHLTKLELDAIRNKDMYIYNPLYRANLARRIHKYIGRGFKLVMPRTYEPLEEYTKSLDDIKEYISETFIPEITTFEEFMEAKKSRLPTISLPDIESENEEEGNCVYASEEKTKIIEEEYDSDVVLYKKDPYQIFYRNQLE